MSSIESSANQYQKLRRQVKGLFRRPGTPSQKQAAEAINRSEALVSMVLNGRALSRPALELLHAYLLTRHDGAVVGRGRKAS